MKNIHVLATDKPSRLFIDIDNEKLTITNNPIGGEHFMNQNICITNDEEIKEGELCYCISNNCIVRFSNFGDNQKNYKKIILTTDQDLIKDGVQAIPDEFLEWFVKNPSCEWVETYSLGITDGVTSHHYKYEIIIPKKEPDYTALLQPVGSRQETLEEAAENYVKDSSHHLYQLRKQCFLDGYKLAQERSYSEEEVLSILQKYRFDFSLYRNIHVLPLEFSKWFEQFKKK